LLCTRFHSAPPASKRASSLSPFSRATYSTTSSKTPQIRGVFCHLATVLCLPLNVHHPSHSLVGHSRCTQQLQTTNE
jgi:hypothetical protein